MGERQKFSNPLDWLKALIALWVFVSTFFFPISNGQAFVRFAGVLLFLFGFWSLAMPASRASRILHIVFCVSLGLSPFLYGYGAPASVNIYIAAALSLFISIYDMIQTRKESR
jgi:hypothetical protein